MTNNVMRHWTAWTAGAGYLVACFSAIGCGSTDKPEASASPASYGNLKIIAHAYYKAAEQLGHPPQKLDDLRPFLPKKGVENNLRSPDDGQDYKILYGVDVRGPSGVGAQAPVLAYEQQGKNGKRYVAIGPNVQHLTDDDFKKAHFPPGHQPPG